ncbi:MAG: BUD31 family protein [archaeon]|nr:BUD31 family protein [archaeon]
MSIPNQTPSFNFALNSSNEDQSKNPNPKTNAIFSEEESPRRSFSPDSPQRSPSQKLNQIPKREFSPSFSDSRNRSNSKDAEKNSSKSRSRSPNRKDEFEFKMKNGCCKNCMKAFSRSGRSCLCQVPKAERKFTLPEKGCNFCGCHGCNPVDVIKEHREELKRRFREDKNISNRNQRILDSDDEELKTYDK